MIADDLNPINGIEGWTVPLGTRKARSHAFGGTASPGRIETIRPRRAARMASGGGSTTITAWSPSLSPSRASG